MSKSDQFIDYGHAELERWRKRLADMEALSEKTRATFQTHLDDMKAQMDKSQDEFRKAQEAGGEQAKAMHDQAQAYQERMKKAWSSLEDGFNKAMRDLKE